MTEAWRILLYPLGFVSACFFGLRFITQWLSSEKAGKSIVPASFWKLSLAGNLSLAIHTFIQLQYPICLVQTCNAVIAWRNLNLMQTRKPPFSLSATIGLILAGACLTTALFWLQGMWLDEGIDNWLRSPSTQWGSEQKSVSWMWHLTGISGYLLFSSRFWVQWWAAEKTKTSQLPVAFWWMSLIGAILSASYFIYLHDTVNMIGPLIGIIPYIRNLMLIQKAAQVYES